MANPGRTASDEPNPYQAPQCAEAGVPISGGINTEGKKRLYVGWLTVFALNLILPGFLGWQTTENGGRLGMLVGAAVLLTVGLWICSRAAKLGFALIIGGIAVALSQVIGILQMLAGISAYACAEALGLVESMQAGPHISNAIGGFVITLITGALLMAAALVAGLMLRALRAVFR